MKRIFLTGASSYVGARMYRDLKDAYEVTGTYFANPLFEELLQLDLTDKEALASAIGNVRPDVVIHVANYPTPRDAPGNEDRYLALNKTATDHVVTQANQAGAAVIFISSQAAKDTGNIYGKLKHESEETVKRAQHGYLILRPGWIVGMSPNTTNDRPFNRILRCLEDRSKTAEFDTSWHLRPTYVGHLASISDHVITHGSWNQTIPVLMPQTTTAYDIARDILTPFGVIVHPINTHMDMPQDHDTTDMEVFNLHPRTYQEMITTIIEEIRTSEVLARSMSL